MEPSPFDILQTISPHLILLISDIMGKPWVIFGVNLPFQERAYWYPIDPGAIWTWGKHVQPCLPRYQKVMVSKKPSPFKVVFPKISKGDALLHLGTFYMVYCLTPNKSNDNSTVPQVMVSLKPSPCDIMGIWNRRLLISWESQTVVLISWESQTVAFWYHGNPKPSPFDIMGIRNRRRFISWESQTRVPLSQTRVPFDIKGIPNQSAFWYHGNPKAECLLINIIGIPNQSAFWYHGNPKAECLLINIIGIPNQSAFWYHGNPKPVPFDNPDHYHWIPWVDIPYRL